MITLGRTTIQTHALVSLWRLRPGTWRRGGTGSYSPGPAPIIFRGRISNRFLIPVAALDHPRLWSPITLGRSQAAGAGRKIAAPAMLGAHGRKVRRTPTGIFGGCKPEAASVKPVKCLANSNPGASWGERAAWMDTQQTDIRGIRAAREAPGILGMSLLAERPGPVHAEAGINSGHARNSFRLFMRGARAGHTPMRAGRGDNAPLMKGRSVRETRRAGAGSVRQTRTGPAPLSLASGDALVMGIQKHAAIDSAGKSFDGVP